MLAGSQDLYGEETLAQVEVQFREVASRIDDAPQIPVRVVPRAVVKSPEQILRVCREANAAEQCIGLMVWMHTFSPAKMWIAGLRALHEAVAAPAHAVQPRAAVVRRSTWTS